MNSTGPAFCVNVVRATDLATSLTPFASVFGRRNPAVCEESPAPDHRPSMEGHSLPPTPERRIIRAQGDPDRSFLSARSVHPRGRIGGSWVSVDRYRQCCSMTWPTPCSAAVRAHSTGHRWSTRSRSSCHSLRRGRNGYLSHPELLENLGIGRGRATQVLRSHYDDGLAASSTEQDGVGRPRKLSMTRHGHQGAG